MRPYQRLEISFVRAAHPQRVFRPQNCPPRQSPFCTSNSRIGAELSRIAVPLPTLCSNSVGLTEKKAEGLQQYFCLVCCETQSEKYGPYKHR